VGKASAPCRRSAAERIAKARNLKLTITALR